MKEIGEYARVTGSLPSQVYVWQCPDLHLLDTDSAKAIRELRMRKSQSKYRRRQQSWNTEKANRVNFDTGTSKDYIEFDDPDESDLHNNVHTDFNPRSWVSYIDLSLCVCVIYV